MSNPNPAERETPAELGGLTDEQIRSLIGQAHAELRARERQRKADFDAMVKRVFDPRNDEPERKGGMPFGGQSL